MSLGISRDSLELQEAIKTGDEISNKIELEFAQNFNDFKEMSTMIGLTKGASCSDVGITMDNCSTGRNSS